MDGVNSRLVEDLSTAPFDFVEHASVRILNISQHSPERLGYELLDFLRLIYTESKGGRLTWSICQHSDSGSPDRIHEFVGLEPRKGNSNFEVKYLSCIYGKCFIVIWLV